MQHQCRYVVRRDYIGGTSTVAEEREFSDDVSGVDGCQARNGLFTQRAAAYVHRARDQEIEAVGRCAFLDDRLPGRVGLFDQIVAQ